MSFTLILNFRLNASLIDSLDLKVIFLIFNWSELQFHQATYFLKWWSVDIFINDNWLYEISALHELARAEPRPGLGLAQNYVIKPNRAELLKSTAWLERAKPYWDLARAKWNKPSHNKFRLELSQLEPAR